MSGKQKVRGLTADMMDVRTDAPVEGNTALKPAALLVEPQPKQQLTKVGFLISPEALHQFDMLKVELVQQPKYAKIGRKNIGPRLIAEALNLLFERHGKPPIVSEL
jgi:hypothetical protein